MLMTHEAERHDQQTHSVLLSALEDARRLIAAGKTQRWEIVKWATAINIGLAGVLVVSRNQLGDKVQQGFFGISAVAVAAVAAILVVHQNRRITGARDRAFRIEECLRPTFDLRSIKDRRSISPKSFWYDWEELLLFGTILACSALYVFIVPWWLK